MMVATLVAINASVAIVAPMVVFGRIRSLEWGSQFVSVCLVEIWLHHEDIFSFNLVQKEIL
jgi:hypothetical protein